MRPFVIREDAPNAARDKWIDPKAQEETTDSTDDTDMESRLPTESRTRRERVAGKRGQRCVFPRPPSTEARSRDENAIRAIRGSLDFFTEENKGNEGLIFFVTFVAFCKSIFFFQARGATNLVGPIDEVWMARAEYLDQLQEAIRATYGVEARHVSTNRFRAMWEDRIAWQGDVETFTGPDGFTCFAWNYEQGGRVETITVLKGGAIETLADAVNAFIASRA